jgi:hypothetical protein
MWGSLQIRGEVKTPRPEFEFNTRAFIPTARRDIMATSITEPLAPGPKGHLILRYPDLNLVAIP